MDDLRCRYCGRGFLKRDHLFRHERVHTKEKPFSCPTCHSRFSRKDVLRRHERSHARKSTGSGPAATSNTDATESSSNHQLSDKPTSTHMSEGPKPRPQTVLEAGVCDNTLIPGLPNILDASLDGLSDTGFPPSLAPVNHQADFDVGLEAWDILNGIFTTSASYCLPSQPSTNSDSEILSSLDPWGHVQHTYCGTAVSGSQERDTLTSEIGCKQNKKDKRTRLIEAMHKAWPTLWSINDFKMSMDIAKPVEQGNMATEKSTLKVYENLMAPMIFDHSLSPNMRFTNMCFKIYVENFWARFPIVHVPSLAPSWENNHLLFFSMCVIGSAFAGSPDALEFGNRLHERIGFLIMSKWKSTMASNSSSTNQMVLILMQLHLDLHALLLGDSDFLARTVTHWGALVLWARRAGILQDFVHDRPSETLQRTTLEDLPASELYCHWRDWVDEEMKLRVAYTIAIIDAEISSIFFQPPLVQFRPERVRALASDALFSAETAEEWRDIAQREADQNQKHIASHSGSIPDMFTHADGHGDSPIQNRFPETRKLHRLERILGIANIATKISTYRSGLFNEDEIFLQQDHLLQQLLEYLPPLFTDQELSTEDSILGSIVSDDSKSIPEENLEASILWHSTFISLYVDRHVLERYHGSQGTQMAQSTVLSLSPTIVVGIVLHCLVIRCLAQKYCQGRHQLPIFASRGVLLAGMQLNWYQDQRRTLFGNQENAALEELEGMDGINETRSESSPIRLEEWINKLNSKDPFLILIKNQPTREKLQSMLRREDIIFSMATALRQSNNTQVNYRSFAHCLEILANNEMGLVM